MKIPLKQYAYLLASYLKPQRGRATLLAIILLSSIGLQILNPQLLGTFIDTALAGGSLQVLFMTAGLFTTVAFVTQVLEVAATYLSEKVAWTATNALRADLAEHCLRLDLSFHKSWTPGELVERVDGDVNALSRFFSQLTIYVIGNSILLLGILLILFLEDWRVGLLLSLFALTSLGTLLRIHSLSVPYWTNLSRVKAEFFGFLGEHLSGVEDLRANGAVSYVMNRFYQLLQRWLPIYYKARLSSAALEATLEGLSLLGNILALTLSAYLWSQEAITVGTIFVIFYYTNLLKTPIEKIQTELQDLQQAEASIYRIQELLQVPPQLGSANPKTLPKGALSVVTEQVWFSYEKSSEPESSFITRYAAMQKQAMSLEQPQNPIINDQEPMTNDTRQWILQNVSFHLPAGQTLGILGRTGSGKTTLARLLLRLHDPQKGSICLGNVPISEIALRELPRRVGLVTQDVQLFQATVRQNLTFFNAQISDEKILQALEILELSEWLRSLPKGLDTELGADSGGLSAGQAQLLALARVFLKDPGLVILDEASSRLDPTTENLIEGAMDRLLMERTTIIIAHRLKTVQKADNILILEDGRVIEYGARETLANTSSSRFAQLLKTGLTEVLS